MGDEIIILQCPQCGSTEIARDTLTTGICQHCGSTVYIKISQCEQKEVPVVSEPSPATIYEPKASGKQIDTDVRDSANTYRTVWDEVEFMRSSLIQIASDESSPEDILNSDISPIEIDVEHYYELEVGNDVVYNCSIGYNRIEQYTSYETQIYYKNGKSYNKTVPVQRTRTVTDWRPFSGNFYDKNFMLLNNESPNADCNRFVEFARNNSSNLITLESSVYRDTPLQKISNNNIQIAINKSQSIATTSCQNQLPGDLYRDFTASCRSEVQDINYYVVPQYNIKFNYEGNLCTANSYVGEKKIFTKLPHNHLKVEKEIDIATKKLAIATISTLSVFALIAALLIGLSFVFSDLGNMIFMVVIALLFLPCLVIYAVYYFKRKKLTNNIIARSLKIKCNKLNKLFDKLNLAPLTDVEKQLFYRAEGDK